MQPARVVTLDHEGRPLALLLRPERLGRDLRVALAAVLAETHSGSFADRGLALARSRRLLLLARGRALLLRRLHRLAERLHQVDHLTTGVLRGLGQRLALRLL